MPGIAALQIQLIGFRIGRLDRERGRLGGEPQLQRRRYCFCDLLFREHRILNLTVILVGPEIAAVRGRNQAHGNADTVAFLTNAPFDDAVDSQLPQIAQIRLLILPANKRCASHHPQTRKIRQRVNQFLSQSTGEVFGVFIGAQIGEGSDQQRRVPGRHRFGRTPCREKPNRQRRDRD